MKFKLFLCTMMAIVAIALSGCVHLPNPYKDVPALPSAGKSPVSLSNGLVLPGESPVTSTAVASAKPVKAPSPARVAIQHAVNWVTVICVLGSLAAIAFGAFLIYSGQILAGVKCVVGGVLLMIASIWFAFHWMLVVGVCLIGAGVYLAVVYWSQIAPIVSKLESEISPALKSIASDVAGLVSKKAATPAPVGTATGAGPTAVPASPAPATSTPAPAPTASVPGHTIA